LGSSIIESGAGWLCLQLGFVIQKHPEVQSGLRVLQGVPSIHMTFHRVVKDDLWEILAHLIRKVTICCNAPQRLPESVSEYFSGKLVAVSLYFAACIDEDLF
jgi:hypothetical protein